MIEVWPAQDVEDAMRAMEASDRHVTTTIIDPWYNKGVGGVRDDYEDYIFQLLESAGRFSEHVFLWGFPEIIAPFVKTPPTGHKLVCWLTWYYKNNPSVIRGWRSSQNACLHFSRPSAKLYPEHFLNEAQEELRSKGKLRYMPGPTSVIEGALLTGFVGRKEQTGHPAQKPEVVYNPLVKMTTKPGDLVFDPMCGSGTTAAVCRQLGRDAIVSDINPDYVAMARLRAEGEVAPGTLNANEGEASERLDLGDHPSGMKPMPERAKKGRGRPRKTRLELTPASSETL